MGNKDQTMDRILEAALQEFGENGYQQASTNRICKSAGVSKGTIFFHFKTKADLYYHTFAHYLGNMLEAMEKADLQEDDPFLMMMKISFWKFEYYIQYPNESSLLLEALSNPPAEIRLRIYSHAQELTKLSIDWLFDKVDMTRYKEEYSPDEVRRYINYSLVGIQHSILHQGIQLEQLNAMKEDTMKYIKTVLKGMEKNDGESI